MITKLGDDKVQMLWLPYPNENPAVQISLHEVGLSITLISTRTCVGKKSEQCGFARRIINKGHSQNWDWQGPPEII